MGLRDSVASDADGFDNEAVPQGWNDPGLCGTHADYDSGIERRARELSQVAISWGGRGVGESDRKRPKNVDGPRQKTALKP